MAHTLPAPHDVRINLLKNPLCLRPGALSFSWATEAVRQTAYRIVIAPGLDHAEAERYVYDTGRVASDRSTAVCPAIPAGILQTGCLYYARVSVWDEGGAESPLSLPLPFTVDTAWVAADAVWAEPDEDGSIPDFLFARYDFSLDADELDEIDRVLVSITATSPEPARQFVYSLSFNGESVGVGPARLGKSPDGKTILYTNTYDITPHLRAGRNTLAALHYTTADHGFLCQVTVYEGDAAGYVLTNSSRDAADWRVLRGDAALGKDNSIGTVYFKAHACNPVADRYPFGFDTPDFIVTDEWEPPCVTGPIGGGIPLVPAESEPMRRILRPSNGVTVERLPDGRLLIDLGTEIVGSLRLSLHAPAAGVITLDYGEQLVPGTRQVKSPMNTSNRYRETWSLPAGPVVMETYSLMTFRYVTVTGYDSPLSPADVTPIEIRKDFDDTQSLLVTDHPLLEDIHALVKHTVRATTQDIYVDSQSRERGAYEGDLLINMLAAYAMEDSFAPARLSTEYLLGHRTWPADYLLTIIYAARADYMATGDDRILRAWYPILRGNLFDNCLRVLEDGGLLLSTPPTGPSNGNAILVDWPPAERDGYDMSLTYNTVFNALVARAVAEMADIATVTGHDADAATLHTRAEDIRATMIARLHDPAIGRFRDGLDADLTPSPHAAQHATAYALACGVYADEAMADRMAKVIEADGGFRMSVYSAFFLLDGLYRTGHGDIANRLMLDGDTAPGARTWAYMLRGLGATITTEAWSEATKPNMTLSHPWGAAPAHMLAAGVAGVRPTAPGYAAFEVAPAPHGIGSLDLTIPTIRGTIRVALDGDTLTLTVPGNTRATVHLPDGRTAAVGAGTHTFSYPA